MITPFPTTFRFLELLRQTGRSFAHNWREYTAATLILGGLTETINYFFLTSSFTPEELTSPKIFLTQEFYGTGIIGIILMTLLSALIIRLTLANLTEKPAPWRLHLQQVGAVFGVLLGTLVLKGLILLGLFILLVIPGIIWMNYYTFSDQLVLARNLTFKKALDASKNMVRGRWWEIFGLNLVIYIYALITQTLLNALAKNILFIPANSWQEIPLFIISTWITSLTVIFLTIYFHHLYTTIENEKKVSANEEEIILASNE